MILKRYRLLILAGLILVGGGYLYLHPELFPARLGVTDYISPGDTGKIEEHANYYDIVVVYATSTPLRASVGNHSDQVAVGLMKGFITTAIAQFKADGKFDKLTPKDIEMMGYDEGRKQSLQISHVSAVSPRTVSYVYTLETYTLGAHGNTDYKTFTFDLKDGKSLKLEDLFVSGAAYLSQLSSLTRTSLGAQLEAAPDDPMIAAGTTPTDTSFQHFFLDDRSLVILFPPYAVASYAAGPQTVAIPRSELKDILKPEYQ